MQNGDGAWGEGRAGPWQVRCRRLPWRVDHFLSLPCRSPPRVPVISVSDRTTTGGSTVHKGTARDGPVGRDGSQSAWPRRAGLGRRN